MSQAVILGCLLGVAGILLVMFYLMRDSSGSAKYALQVILLSFLLGIVVLIGKLAVDNSTPCAWLVANSTVVNSTQTSYDYSYTCGVSNSSVSSTFYSITLWVMRLTAAYLILVFAFELIEYFGSEKKKKIEGEE